MQLKIEREALKKETDKASKDRLEKLEKELGELEEKSATLTQRWKQEKAKLGSDAEAEGEARPGAPRAGGRAAQRRSRQSGRARLRRDPRPREGIEAGRRPSRRPARQRRGDRREHRAGRLALDRHSGRQDARRRTREAAEDGRGARRPRRRPGRSGEGGLDRGAPRARRLAGSEPPDRLVPVPRADRRRQDRADQGARRVPVQRRHRADPHRHVGVHGEALGLAPDRRAAGLCRLRRRRCSDRSGAPPPLSGDPVRRGRKGAPRRLQRAAASARRRPLDRRAGPHRRLQEHGDHPHLELGQRYFRRAGRGRRYRGRARRRDGDRAPSLPPGIPEPLGRDHPLPSLDRARHGQDRRHPGPALGQALSPIARSSSKLDKKAKEWLANAGYDPVYGARPLKRAIQKYLQDPLAEQILQGQIKDGDRSRHRRQGRPAASTNGGAAPRSTKLSSREFTGEGDPKLWKGGGGGEASSDLERTIRDHLADREPGTAQRKRRARLTLTHGHLSPRISRCATFPASLPLISQVPTPSVTAPSRLNGISGRIADLERQRTRRRRDDRRRPHLARD